MKRLKHIYLAAIVFVVGCKSPNNDSTEFNGPVTGADADPEGGGGTIVSNPSWQTLSLTGLSSSGLSDAVICPSHIEFYNSAESYSMAFADSVAGRSVTLSDTLELQYLVPDSTPQNLACDGFKIVLTANEAACDFKAASVVNTNGSFVLDQESLARLGLSRIEMNFNVSGTIGSFAIDATPFANNLSAISNRNNLLRVLQDPLGYVLEDDIAGDALPTPPRTAASTKAGSVKK
jgi:hypothetical protein